MIIRESGLYKLVDSYIVKESPFSRTFRRGSVISIIQVDRESQNVFSPEFGY